jgi:hypothetical protein
LVGKDGPERPGDRNGCREITFGGGEGIGSGCSFEEEAALGSVAEKTELQGEELTGQGRQRLSSRHRHGGEWR